MSQRRFASQDLGILRWLNSCFDSWIEQNFILWSPGHRILRRTSKDRSIVWATYDPKEYKPAGLVWSSVSEYLSILKSGQYSALLFDGSLLQITVDYSELELVGHRYAYFPCPIVPSLVGIDQASAAGLPLDEYLRESIQTAPIEELRSWPTMRFDFVSTEVKGEPFSHLHLGPEECRLPLLGPLSLFRFFSFLARSFYSNSPPVTPTIPLGTFVESTLRSAEHDPLHVTWSVR